MSYGNYLRGLLTAKIVYTGLITRVVKKELKY